MNPDRFGLDTIILNDFVTDIYEWTDEVEFKSVQRCAVEWAWLGYM